MATLTMQSAPPPPPAQPAPPPLPDGEDDDVAPQASAAHAAYHHSSTQPVWQQAHYAAQPAYHPPGHPHPGQPPAYPYSYHAGPSAPYNPYAAHGAWHPHYAHQYPSYPHAYPHAAPPGQAHPSGPPLPYAAAYPQTPQQPAYAAPPAPAPLPAPSTHAPPERAAVSFQLHPAYSASPQNASGAQGTDIAQMPRTTRRHFSSGPADRPGVVAASSGPAAGPAVSVSKTTETPNSFQEWVRRCNRAHPDQREAMRARIKAVLQPLVDYGTWTRHDWDREPVPQLASSATSSFDDLDDMRKDKFGKRRPSPDSDDVSASPLAKRTARGAASAQTAKGKKGKKGGKRVRNGAPANAGANVAAVSARAARFGTAGRGASAAATAARPEDDEDDWHAGNVIVQGQCQELEKEFFRLNGAPDPVKVRPEPVIQKALDRLVGMMARGEQPYRYHWSQLKAMRQDLIVQHLKSEIAAAVEEAFARRALEHGDMRNYQKCSTALRVLFDAGVQGSRAEFDAYRILANVCQDHCTPDEVLKAIKDAFVHGVGESAEVQHALAVQRALTLGNIAGFWKLYGAAPHCSRHIMDRAVPGVRLQAARTLVLRFKPAAPAAMCTCMLGFDVPPRTCDASAPLQPGCSEELRAAQVQALSAAQRQAHCKAFLQQLGAVVSAADGGTWQLCAKSNKSDSLKLPDKDDMKQHGASEVKLTDFKKISV